MQSDAGLRIGTCSWNYDSWVGLVYSAAQRRAVDYLAEYSNQYDTVEIDSTFYAIPSRDSIAEYASAVREGFRWTCKAPRQITLTHHRGKRGAAPEPNAGFLSVDETRRFLDAIEPILASTDAVMFEFEYLNRIKMPGGGAEFIDRLGSFLTRLPDGVPYAVEPRNSRYITGEWFSFLQGLGVAHVFSQKQYLPNVWELFRSNESVIRTMPRAVVRLLGGDRKEIEERTGGRWDAIVEPRDDEREKILGVVASYVGEAYAILNVNNHYEGSAPVSIRSIREYFRSAGM